MNELERLIVSLVGDASEYQQMLTDAIAATGGAASLIEAQADVVSQAFQRQLETYSMTGRELEIYRMQMGGASEDQLQLARAIDQEMTARERQASLYQQGSQLTSAMRTATEVYNDRMAELKQLLDSGSISQETFNRAAAQAKMSLDQASQSTGIFASAMGGLQRASQSTWGILAQIGLGMGAIGLVVQSVRLSGQMEQMQVDMEVLLGSADKATKTLADLEAFSAHTPYELPSLVKAGSNLALMGAEAQDIVPLLKLVGNAAGSNSERFERLSYVMSRVISTHRLTGHEVHMLTMSGFNPMASMAKATGQTVEQLTAQMHRGGIGADVFLRGLMQASAVGGQLAGRLEKGSVTLGGLLTTMMDGVHKVMRQLGSIIAEGLDLKGVERNVAAFAETVVGWLKTITPESKRIISVVLTVVAAIGVASVALFALMPVFSLVGTGISIVTALLGAIFSPIGLVVVAVAALTGAWLYFTESGGQAMEWFGEQIAKLKAFFAPAIQGIKDAISAGDLDLAFQITWAQIKLTFFASIRPLREGWIDLVFAMKYLWAEASAGIQSTWDSTQMGIAQGLTWLAEKAGVYSAEEAAGINRTMAEDHARTLKRIDADRKASIDKALGDANKANADVNAELEDLYKKRDALTADAAKKAAAPKKVEVTPTLDPNKFKPPPQKMKVTPEVKWEAVVAEGAEALSRMFQYESMLAGTGAGLGAKGGRGAGGGAHGAMADPTLGPASDASQYSGPIPVGGAPDDPTRDKALSALTDIAGNTGVSARRPPVNLSPADFE